MSRRDPRGGAGGWIVFLAIGIFNAVQGLILLAFGGEAVEDSILGVTGSSWAQLQGSNPGFAAYVGDLLTILGLFISTFGVMIAAIALSGYRRGRFWAWCTMWAAPVFYSLTALILVVKGDIYYSDDLSIELFLFLLVISLLVLAVEAPSFRRPTTPRTG